MISFYLKYLISISFPIMEHFKWYIGNYNSSIGQSFDTTHVYDRVLGDVWLFSIMTYFGFTIQILLKHIKFRLIED